MARYRVSPPSSSPFLHDDLCSPRRCQGEEHGRGERGSSMTRCDSYTTQDHLTFHVAPPNSTEMHLDTSNVVFPTFYLGSLKPL